MTPEAFPGDTEEADACLATRILGLRTPLARVELLASQLAREAATPAARRLAEDISAAVAELDRGIDASLTAVAPADPVADAASDCREVVRAVSLRLAPVLEARGVRSRLGLPDVRVTGDAGITRQAALALLRAGLELSARGDVLGLSLVDEGLRYGLLLDAGVAAACPPDSERDPFAAARAVALVRHAALEIAPPGVSPRAALWLTRREIA